jgi:hypothetical protein
VASSTNTLLLSALPTEYEKRYGKQLDYTTAASFGGKLAPFLRQHLADVVKLRQLDSLGKTFAVEAFTERRRIMTRAIPTGDYKRKRDGVDIVQDEAASDALHKDSNIGGEDLTLVAAAAAVERGLERGLVASSPLAWMRLEIRHLFNLSPGGIGISDMAVKYQSCYGKSLQDAIALLVRTNSLTSEKDKTGKPKLSFFLREDLSDVVNIQPGPDPKSGKYVLYPVPMVGRPPVMPIARVPPPPPVIPSSSGPVTAGEKRTGDSPRVSDVADLPAPLAKAGFGSGVALEPLVPPLADLASPPPPPAMQAVQQGGEDHQQPHLARPPSPPANARRAAGRVPEAAATRESGPSAGDRRGASRGGAAARRGGAVQFQCS